MKNSGPKPKYQRRPHEDAAVAKFRRAQAVAAPGLKPVMGDHGLVELVPDHPDELTGDSLVMEGWGTTDPDFCVALIRQITHATSKHGQPNVRDANFILAVVIGIKPRDQIETMLAVEMAIVHTATMASARPVNEAYAAQQRDSAAQALNKLTRTFLSQVDALKRYRSGGEQKVTVQHVTVAEGGQAIVGTVTQGRDAVALGAPSESMVLTNDETAAMPVVENVAPPAAKVRRTRKAK